MYICTVSTEFVIYWQSKMVSVSCRIGDVNIRYTTSGKRIMSLILLCTVQESCNLFTLHEMDSIILAKSDGEKVEMLI